MLALGYTIVAILLFVTFVCALAVCLGLWFGIKTVRPEALESPDGRDRPA